MTTDEPDLRRSYETTSRRFGLVYETAGWRPGIDLPGSRWSAICEYGEVFQSHTKNEACAQLADHECLPDRPRWFNRASTDPGWVSDQIARPPAGHPGQPPPSLDEGAEYFDSAEFNRQGQLYRSMLTHWSPSLRVSGTFQTGSVSLNFIAQNERGLSQALDVVLGFPDDVSVVRLYLEPNIEPCPGQLSTLRFDFDRSQGVAAAALLAVDKARQVYAWVTQGDAGRDHIYLAHDSWNAAETQLLPDSFVTIPELRTAIIQWAYGEGILPPPAIHWMPAPELGWL